MVKREAVKKANALLKRMKSSGWQTRVWEFLGEWHYMVEQGPVYVMPVGHKEDYYFAGVRCEGVDLSINSYAPSDTSKDPNIAVRNQATHLRRVSQSVVDVFDTIHKVVQNGREEQLKKSSSFISSSRTNRGGSLVLPTNNDNINIMQQVQS